jgi:hypothetical protein
MTLDWTKEMDAALLKGRDADPPVGWKRLVLAIAPGLTRAEAEKRLRLLKGGSPDEGGPLRADGLAWLLRKGRLSAARAEQAARYRKAFRDAGGVSVKSSANVGTGGGAPGPGHFEVAMNAHTQGQRDLFHMQAEVLKGQFDMLIVMDAVCGIGHSLRELAGGDWVRANELEVALKVALDLLHADQYGVAQKLA